VVNVRGRVVRFAARRWVALVLVVLVAVFIGQNRDRVSIDLFWAHLKAPLWFVLLITAIVGVIIGWLTSRRRAQRAAGHRAAGPGKAGSGHADPDSPRRAP
jgi:putative membrane protein